MPSVASTASVLQTPGLGPRSRAAETSYSGAPFSMLLASTERPSTPQEPARPATASSRRADSARPEQTEAPDSAGEQRPPEASQPEAAGQTGSAAPAEHSEPADAAVQAEPGPNDEAVALAPVLAALIDAPPAQPQAVIAPTPAPAPEIAMAVVADTPAPTGEVLAVITPIVAAPGTVVPAAPTAAAGTGEASLRTGPAAPTPPAPAAATPEQPAPSVAAPAIETPAQIEPQPQPQRTHPASLPAPERLPAHDAGDQARVGSAVSEFVQTARPGPEGLPLAGLHSGRDFGQMVAATAHAASGNGPLVAAPVPLEALAVEIATRAQAGRNRFEIRLDPPELGRIEVRLDIDRSGQVTSRLVVERAETLDVLRRDAHQLERALQDAGLKTADSGLQFTLRDQAFADRGGSSDTPRTVFADPEPAAADAPAVSCGLTLRGNGGVDIRI